MENTRATVDILNDLVQINNDRIRGFQHALNDVKDGDTDIRYLFTNCIGQSHQFKMELATEVQALSNPKDVQNNSSVPGALHRTWLDLKAKFSSHTTHSILEDCEFGEDTIIKTYTLALDEDYIPAYIREMLTKHKVILQKSHDEVRSLRDAVAH
ncbi:PA2169 family four-helix-bundle protein [Mucilaginibacter sp. JRF]|uniref:ferritin-like domain-containing protein n=1 Tax=Mucilaginibacter sp. JRF TaxID=2780088 RepID=UPI00187E59FE|nr:PA2169 family four-helix-bundle protein [Mucilaginibacter sp. JRF]MBE9583513.1 PA2169 family four-helix-bundle protein [Mucilaginibacter sp. JRF]